MLNVDALKQLKQLKTEIKASRNLSVGVVKGSSNKFGFVSLEGGKDVFLPADEMQKVLPGDKVEVEIKKEPKNKTLAVIERLLDSPVKEFHGSYIVKGKAHFVDADIPGLSRWIFIPPQKRKGGKHGDLVKCRLTQHPIKQGKPQAAVLEILGNIERSGVIWDYAISKHGLPVEWSAKANSQIAEIDAAAIEAAKASRKDLSDIPFITIDAATTQDMDDALWAESTANGWRLKVAIADPAALLHKWPDLEKECLTRACSAYFPGRSIAMLPTELGSDLCSLKAGCERLAKVIHLEISKQGEVSGFEIEPAWIKSDAKLSYKEVTDLLEGQPADQTTVNPSLKENIHALSEATRAMREWRKQNALVNEGRQEFFFELNDQLKVVAIHPKPQTPAHLIVEEAMLAANRSVASFLSSHTESSIYVAHDGVREDRLEGIKRALDEVFPGGIAEKINQLDTFKQLVNELQAPDKEALRHLVLKQMSKSRLSLTPAPHFGLGLEVYTTFTSPLRKAHDYLLHKQVEELLCGERNAAINQKQLDRLDEAQRAVRGAVNDVEQWLRCQFIAEHGIKDGTAEIVRTFSSGFQVRLLENGIEGFVSTKELEGKYSFNQDLMRISGPAGNFVLGQQLQVTLKQVDHSRKQIQFNLS